MFRKASTYLNEWHHRHDRKPLIIRGARQVGKSYLVRDFAQTHRLKLYEFDFEKHPEHATLFEAKDPDKILSVLELHFGESILVPKSVLFLDEIQQVPHLLSNLRYFQEDMPQLRVVTAGSLLDFALSEADFSMPVGKVEHLFLGPMTFEEFLVGLGEEKLVHFLQNFTLDQTIPLPIHEKLKGHIHTYLIVGGMPDAVQTLVTTRRLTESDRIKSNLLLTYQDDFRKYRKRVSYERLLKVFHNVPLQVGEKFKYSKVDAREQARDLASVLDLLCMARVAHRVYKSAAGGVPLNAFINEKFFKVLFLDVGLMVKSAGLNLIQIQQAKNIILVNRGALAEQFVGQHLLYSQPFYREPELYYWMREKPTSAAEVDYVIEVNGQVIPLEVKSGTSGTLKSLHVFVQEKKCRLGIRLNTDVPSHGQIKTALAGQKSVSFELISLPLYLVGQIERLIQ